MVTTKKLHTRSIIFELLWFLRGDTNVRFLNENNVSIWDEWANDAGDLGPVYGAQWRSWPTADGGRVDQIQQVIDALRRDPDSRRRMLDQGIVSKKPLVVEVLARYRRVLTAKRRLLAAEGESGPDDTLQAWNGLLAEVGTELIRLRSSYVDELQSAFEATLAENRIKLRPVDFRYRPSPASGGESVGDFLEALQRERGRELQRRRSLVGPHRDRLEIRWGMTDIGRAASAGERKLFGLVLTAARRRVYRVSVS